MQLVYSISKDPVQIGDICIVRGTEYEITAIEPPRHGGSTGRIYWKETGHSCASGGYYPSVFGAEWINRTDQGT